MENAKSKIYLHKNLKNLNNSSFCFVLRCKDRHFATILQIFHEKNLEIIEKCGKIIIFIQKCGKKLVIFIA